MGGTSGEVGGGRILGHLALDPTLEHLALRYQLSVYKGTALDTHIARALA